MKAKQVFLSLALIFSCLCSCDDNTDNIGGSIIDDLDNINVTARSFPISSKSVKADSVYSRSATGYLGKVKDPETGAFVKGDFLTQFYTLEGKQLPAEKSIVSRLKDGSIIADSCVIYLYYDKYYGDSLSTMKLNMLELSKPMEENKKYYSDFNPLKSDDNYCRTDEGRVNVNKTYTLYDLASDTVPKKIKINLPNSELDENGNLIEEKAAYKDKEKKGYYNYGTYIMQKYYSNPKLFKDSYSFIHNICPGFYFKSSDGLGSMAYINMSQMLVYYKYKYEKTTNGEKKDTTVNVVTTFAGTEEVIQSTRISNDNAAIDKMVEEGNKNDITYIKSPAGIFTELTIPVDEILNGHENDTINSARISLTRINNTKHEKYNLDIPTTLLLIPNDMRTSFFEEGKIPDNVQTYTAVFATSDQSSLAKQNSYTFHNVANLIAYMNRKRSEGIKEYEGKGMSSADAKTMWEKKHPTWNKVLVIPVETTYVTTGQTTKLVKVTNDMSLTASKFVKGSMTGDANITIDVVYSKFQK